MAMLNNQMVNNDGDIPRKGFNHQVRNMGKQKKVRFQFPLINRDFDGTIYNRDDHQ